MWERDVYKMHSTQRRILLITNDFGPRAGGIETFIIGLLERVPKDSVAIYTSSEPGESAFDAHWREKFGVIVHRDRSKVMIPTSRVIKNVKRVMKEHQSTLIWFGSSAPLALMAPSLRKAGARKIIALTHGHEVWWAKVWPFSWAISYIGNAVDHLTCLCDFTREAISKSLSHAAKKAMVTISPGIDIDHFIPAISPAEIARRKSLRSRYHLGDDPTIISVGRLVHRKGQDKLIQGLPAIRKEIPNARLVLIGEGPYRKKLEKLTADNNLGDAVIFIGRIPHHELPSYISMGDVFAMPSRSRFFGLEVEGLGIVYLEASACGLPVLAGDSGGAPETVQRGITGDVVDGRDEMAIANSLITLLKDPVRLKKMGEAGRQWIVQEWNWKIFATRFNELLK